MLSVSDVERLLQAEAAGGDDEAGWYEYYGRKTPFEVKGLGDIYVIDDVGGEGQGDYRHLVFQWEDPEVGSRFFKKTGYYASYDGTTWDGAFTEVRPREKMITVYE